MCKSELVRDGDFPFVIIYSYLFVGVGLAQNFKPITIFTREFQISVHKELGVWKKLYLITSAWIFLHKFSFPFTFILLKIFQTFRSFMEDKFSLFMFFTRDENFPRLNCICIVICREYDENLWCSGFICFWKWGFLGRNTESGDTRLKESRRIFSDFHRLNESFPNETWQNIYVEVNSLRNFPVIQKLA